MRQRKSSGEDGRGTHQSNQAIRVEHMLTRENVELPDKQHLAAPRTCLVSIHRDESSFQSLDILLDLISTVGRILHVLPKLVYPAAV